MLLGVAPALTGAEARNFTMLSAGPAPLFYIVHGPQMTRPAPDPYARCTRRERLGLALAGALFRVREAAAALLRRRPAGGKPGSVLGFEAVGMDGRPRRLADYKGSVLLLVNTASRCGFTPQYAALERLHRDYGPRGLRVLAFPCDDFGGQEPGSDQEIRSFCSDRYAVSFELFSKIRARGDAAHPLYRFLAAESGFPGEISWNFTKFLVDREGRVAARYGPREDPAGPKLVREIERLLA